MTEILKELNLDLVKNIRETMGFLEINEFNEMDSLISTFSPIQFIEFTKLKTSHLPLEQKNRAINYLAARRAHLEFVKENDKKIEIND